MLRTTAALALLFAALAAPLFAQTAPTKPLPPNVRLGAVPELLAFQMPSLPRGEGVVVEELQPAAPLAQAGVRKFDILLKFAGTPLRDGEQFAALLSQPQANRDLQLVRRGALVTLSLPPTLTLSPAQVAKGTTKEGGPPAVTVDAQPLQDGKLKVTFLYYSDHTGKVESVTCSGSLGEIEREVRHLNERNRMSPRVQDLVDVALKRIRTLTPSESR